jgi:hypothetical protein
MTDGMGTGATPGSTGGIFGTEQQSRSSEGSPSPMDDEQS